MRSIFFKIVVVAAALVCGWGVAFAQSTIEIGLNSTTHVLFTSDLTYVDISSPDKIVAKVVDASKNMLAIKAREEFAFKTTVSALEANGTMHTFYVMFNPSPSRLVIDTRVKDGGTGDVVNTQIRPDSDAVVSVQEPPASSSSSSQLPPPKKENGKERKGTSLKGKKSTVTTETVTPQGVSVTSSQTSNFGRTNAPTIEEVMRKPREIYHLTDKSYRLTASVVNVYAYSDLTYVVIEVENNSDIGFESGDAQFTIESRRSGKQLATDKSVWAKSSYGTLSCAPNSKTLMGYTIPKLTLQKNEVFKIYIYEKGGTRNLFLTLVDKDVNYAVSPVE